MNAAARTVSRPAAATTNGSKPGPPAPTGAAAADAAQPAAAAGVAPTGRALARYYADPAVRRRIGEYLGGPALGEATACFVSHPLADREHPFAPLPPTRIWDLLGAHHEAARSLADRESLIAHLDVEHVHFDRPWQALADRARSERLQRPLVAAIQEILRQHGIAPLHLLTGRGHHFVWRMASGTRVFARLAGMGVLTDSLRQLYRTPQPPIGAVVGEAQGAAQQALGKVLEWLAQRALARAAADTEVPIELTAVAVGPGPGGREIVSFDLSQYGDPLHVRSLRIPFTAYRKAAHWGAPAALQERPLVVLPVLDGDTEAARAAQGDLAAAAAAARRACCAIPEAGAGTEHLLAAYLGSGLAAFHARYEAVQPEPPERWPETYDRLDPATLPQCVQTILAEPNDLLLQPAAIQMVVRTLLAQGWQARHVAGLLTSKYSRDHGWIPGIHFTEPGVRADFYVRLFAGLLATGLDSLIDCNCQSTREKGYCPGTGCGWDLRTLAGALRHGKSDG